MLRRLICKSGDNRKPTAHALNTELHILNLVMPVTLQCGFSFVPLNTTLLDKEATKA